MKGYVTNRRLLFGVWQVDIQGALKALPTPGFRPLARSFKPWDFRTQCPAHSEMVTLMVRVGAEQKPAEFA